jgi:hypothetical protein
MKIRVLKGFTDKFNRGLTHEPGEVITEFDDSRVREIVHRGLAEIIEDEPVAGKSTGNKTKAASNLKNK